MVFKDLSRFLKELGVVDWSYTVDLGPVTFDGLNEWVNRKDHGVLSYLSDHRKDARKSLKSVYEDCESALIFLFSYHPQKLALEEVYRDPNWNGLKFGSYVLGFKGVDYHFEVKERLTKIAEQLKLDYPDLEYRFALDVHPVLERDLAYRSGLGWFGKNSMMISKEHGSYTILGTLLLNQKLDLNSSQMEVDHCGQCRACIEACPTDAISEETRTIVANKCISTFTIEMFKEGVPPAGMEKSNGEFFGCDICQEVCPWNKRPVRLNKVTAQESDQFLEDNKMIINDFLKTPLNQIKDNLESMSNNQFAKKYKSTPLGRTGRLGILKNIKFWLTKKS